MTIVLDGTNGITTPDLESAGPVTGTTATFSGNVGIGTSSPSGASGTTLAINGGAGQARLALKNTSSGDAAGDGLQIALDNTAGGIEMRENLPLYFTTNNIERARIDTSGNLLVGCTTANTTKGVNISPSGGINFVVQNNTGYAAGFYTNNTITSAAGNIFLSGTSTTYATSSDYRLKENISPMTGALTKVAQLNPVTYTWKADGSSGEGFIAHELAEVCSHAVLGEKDAVNEDGTPKYQGIDTSFLVATLTAAIQEQQAIIIALTARVAALEGTQP